MSTMTTTVEKKADEKYCHECAAVIRAKAEICPKCGVRQPTSSGGGFNGFATTPSGRSKLAAGIFAIFLGGLGIHKFYLGRVGQGIVYILFCWTFIPAIIGFIEGLVYLTMSDQAFAEKYS